MIRYINFQWIARHYYWHLINCRDWEHHHLNFGRGKKHLVGGWFSHHNRDRGSDTSRYGHEWHVVKLTKHIIEFHCYVHTMVWRYWTSCSTAKVLITRMFRSRGLVKVVLPAEEVPRDRNVLVIKTFAVLREVQ